MLLWSDDPLCFLSSNIGSVCRMGKLGSQSKHPIDLAASLSYCVTAGKGDRPKGALGFFPAATFRERELHQKMTP